MDTAIQLKRKNIDLPAETLKKLSIMAIAQGKSLKKYIETILIAKADSIAVEISENPSPSGDQWFESKENVDEVKAAILESKAGGNKTYSIDELRNMLGA